MVAEAIKQPEGYQERARAGELTDEDILWQAEQERTIPTKREMAAATTANRAERIAQAARRVERLERAKRDDPKLAEEQQGSTGTLKRGFLNALSVDLVQPPILGVIADKGATVIYGWGGSGKGTLVTYFIIEVLRADPNARILLIDAEKRLYEWLPRLKALQIPPEYLDRILYYQTDGRPIWDQASEIMTYCAEQNFIPTLAVVDSAERACGVDLSTGNNEFPILYYNTLDSLCERHLTIAHISEGSNLRKPFGSKRWHDDARLTWSLEAKGDMRLFVNQKNNNGPLLPSRAFHVAEWTDGPVKFPTRIEEVVYQEQLKEIMKRVITEPMTYEDIENAVNDGIEQAGLKHSRDAIRKQISRNKDTFERVGGTNANPIFRVIRPETPEEPVIDYTCHKCNDSLSPEDVDYEGEFRIHRGGCPTGETE